ncbi:uncharacterized protein PRCAT00003156001 [Priceomyces carsonii]|uniref:uncharacterized protein n=1 Tax=Priceomyces carsonii TaxID=28549 RepID=UPI002EDB89A5|nr:unnamed protein product [Priceomyces carsonii]
MLDGKITKPKSKNAPVSMKETERKRRQVFKPILDNPFTQSNTWPYIEPQLGEDLTTILTKTLSCIGKYNLAVSEANTKKSLARPSIPEIRSNLTIGFNSTVEALEKQAGIYRTSSKRKKQKPHDNIIIKYVFVTKFDIKPSILTESFPVLTYTASRSKEDRVKLVQLPKGSMARISEALHIDHTGIIGVSSKVSELSALCSLVESKVGDVQIPWLEGLLHEDDNSNFSKPVINFLNTSAPIQSKNNKQSSKKESKK